jgi:hypothetical protein
VAVDQPCLRLYLGLENGQLEEHAIQHSDSGVTAALSARKHAAKKVRQTLSRTNWAAVLACVGKQLCIAFLGCRQSLESRCCLTMAC